MGSKLQPFDSPPPAFSSEDVYFLRGKIEISQVRNLQVLERVGDRQAAPPSVYGSRPRAPRCTGVEDHRGRLVNPYWRGPHMAAVLERAYRLKP
jgi:hypothetical protein